MTFVMLLFDIGIAVLAAVVGVFLMNDPWSKEDLHNAWTWVKTHVLHITSRDE